MRAKFHFSRRLMRCKTMGRTNDLLCLVSLPGDCVIAIEVERNSCALPIFEEVCRRLNILQKDFFGLQVREDKYCIARWLNLRNPLSVEVNCSCPVKLTFSIKYYVQPHHLLQDSTRDAFFKIARNNFLTDQFNAAGETFIDESSALLCRCFDPDDECSNANNNNNDRNNSKNIINSNNNNDISNNNNTDNNSSSSSSSNNSNDSVPCAVLPRSCWDAHRLAKVKDMSSNLAVSGSAEGRRLFLEQLHHCMSTVGHRFPATLNGSRQELCVLSRGLSLINEKLEVVSNHEWISTQQAVHNGCEVIVHVTSSEPLVYTFRSKAVANAFYRDLTEVYTFFHCDTVDDAITGQTCRDFKGTIVSLFNENSNFGKAYVFDIEHTLREMSDLIRRQIFHQEEKDKHPINWDQESDENKIIADVKHEAACNCKAAEHLKELRNLFTCSLCISGHVDTTFVPCGHVFCCEGCSSKVDLCPLCKDPIVAVQRIYLPGAPF